jgi:hypothetical protein
LPFSALLLIAAAAAQNDDNDKNYPDTAIFTETFIKAHVIVTSLIIY